MYMYMYVYKGGDKGKMNVGHKDLHFIAMYIIRKTFEAENPVQAL